MHKSSIHFQQLVTEIQQIKYSWNDLLLESKSIAFNLNLTTECRISSRVRRKNIFMMIFLMNSPSKILKTNL